MRTPQCLAIGEHGEEAEEGGQHVFALGDPGDGLDAEWMQGEESTDGEGAAAAAGHAQQEQRQQGGIGEMQQQADGVVRARTHAEELDVERV